MYKKYLIGTLISVSSLSCFAQSPAAPVVDQLITEITAAKSIERATPKYPRMAAKLGQEGWVKVSYIVEPDGSVSHPIIEDSSGLKTFESAALEAIKQWKYTPAFENGKATQQCNTAVQLDFILNKKGKPGARKRFARKYKIIKKLIESNQLEQAQTELETFAAKATWNLYESSRLHILQASYNKAIGDPKNYLNSLFKASASNGAYLPKQLYDYVLQEKYVTAIELKRYHTALYVINKIKTLHKKEASPTFAKLIAHAEKVKEYIASDNLFKVAGKVGKQDFWRHTLVRNAFSFANVSGNLTKLDIRCNNQRNIYTVSEQSKWTLPKSWGTCHLYVYGEDNTTFDLIESHGSNTVTKI